MHTQSLLLNIFLFLVGLGLLVKGSGWFVDAAAYVARRFHISEMVIGLTLVSIGTSLPELATNVYASWINEGPVALGNVAGSNVANTLLILGVAATLTAGIPVARILFRRDAVIMLGTYCLFAVFCYLPAAAPSLSRVESAVLLAIFVWYVWHLLRTPDTAAASGDSAAGAINSLGMAVLALVGGGAMVIFGARLMVDNVVWAAQTRFHVPEELVSATIIAFGTSAPELAVTVAGILKKKNDIALGNVIGSNIFNILLIMGVTGLVNPVAVTGNARTIILPFMFASGAALVILLRSGWRLTRGEGLAFLAGYVGFIGFSAYECMR